MVKGKLSKTACGDNHLHDIRTLPWVLLQYRQSWFHWVFLHSRFTYTVLFASFFSLISKLYFVVDVYLFGACKRPDEVLLWLPKIYCYLWPALLLSNQNTLMISSDSVLFIPMDKFTNPAVCRPKPNAIASHQIFYKTILPMFYQVQMIPQHEVTYSFFKKSEEGVYSSFNEFKGQKSHYILLTLLSKTCIYFIHFTKWYCLNCPLLHSLPIAMPFLRV